MMELDNKVIKLSVKDFKSKTKKPTKSGKPKDAQVFKLKNLEILNDINLEWVWLYCDKCLSCQYSTIISPGGRTHNLCGSQVREKVVKFNPQVEYDIAWYNVMVIEKLKKLIADKQPLNFSQYVNDYVDNYLKTMEYFITALEKTSQLKELVQFQFAELETRVANYIKNELAKPDVLDLLISKFFWAAQEFKKS